jgi:excisionase family DNA binding protein
LIQPDLSNWLTAEQAAAAMGISERSLYRMTSDGGVPEKRERPRPGKKPEPVYKPEDVDAFVEAKLAKLGQGRVIPQAWPAPVPYGPPGPAPDAYSGAPPALAEFFESIKKLSQLALPPPEKYLTIEEAVERTGLSRTRLWRAIRAKELPTIRDGSRKVRTSDLDNFVRLQISV